MHKNTAMTNKVRSRISAGLLRWEAMVRAVIPDHLVFKFMQESKAALIPARVPQASNPPSDPQKCFEKLFSVHPREWIGILLKWLMRHGMLTDAASVPEALESLADMPPDQWADEATRPLWLALIAGLADHSDSPEILAFLSPTKENGNARLTPVSFQSEGIEPADIDDALGLVRGTSSPGHPHKLVSRSIAVAFAAGRNDQALLGKLLDTSDDVPSALLERLVRFGNIEAGRSDASPQSEVQVVSCRRATVSGPIDSDGSVRVLGHFTNQTAQGTRFFSIFGVFRDGQWLEVTSKDALIAFPGTGSAILFPARAGAMANPDQTDWVLDIARENPSEKTQYVVQQVVGRALTVSEVPHHSDHPDQVRNWVQSHIHRGAGSTLFLLQDGLALLPRSSVQPLENSVAAYRSIVVHQLAGKSLILSALPAAVETYDWAPPEVLIGRLLKQQKDLEDVPRLTKAHIGRLQESVTAEFIGLGIRRSALRALELVSSVELGRDLADQVVERVLQRPDIQQAIEERKAELVSTYRKEADRIREEIEELKAARATQEETLKRIRAQNESTTAALTKELQRAFERTTQNGFAKLAEVATLAPFLAPNGSVAPAAHTATPTVSALLAPTVDGSPILDAEGLVVATKLYSLYSGVSSTYCKAVISAMLAAGFVSISGSQGGVLRGLVGDTLAGGNTVEVSVSGDMFGWADLLNAPIALCRTQVAPSTLGAFLEQCQAESIPCHVVLRGFNRVPPEAILPELLEAAGRRGVGRVVAWRGEGGVPRALRIVAPIFFTLDLIAGQTTFPIPKPYASIVAWFNADHPWDDSNVRHDIERPLHYWVADHASHTSGENAPQAHHIECSSIVERTKRLMESLNVPMDELAELTRCAFLLGRVERQVLEEAVSREAPSLRARVVGYIGACYETQLLPAVK